MNLKLSSVQLPKWPGFICVGDNVTPDQAAIIQVRTSNLYGLTCNDRNWEKLVYKELNIPQNEYRCIDYDAADKAVKNYKNLGLEYLTNWHISSCWVGGPHGWCDWEGNIGCSNYNVGKWPEAVELFDEWQKIAQAFPYLNMRCQFGDREIGEEGLRPLIQFYMRNGLTWWLVPSEDEKLFTQPLDFVWNVGKRYGERGCTLAQLKHALSLVSV